MDNGVPRNYVAAYKWFDIAARWHRFSWWIIITPDGYAPLRQEMDRLAERMTAEQVAEARLAADAFLETYRS